MRLVLELDLTHQQILAGVDDMVEAAMRGADVYSAEDRQAVMGFVMMLSTAIHNA
jgi:hypothetical protein